MLSSKVIVAAAVSAVTMVSVAPAQTVAPIARDTAEPVGIVENPCRDAGQSAAPRPGPDRDFGGFCRYQDANRSAEARNARVVFLGDSITEGWIKADPNLFTQGVIDRGIGGQTTPQMLVRFRQDVVALRPKAVHIMAGTNDIAGNTGPATMETVQGHVMSMAELARANGIKVMIASVPPAGSFPWRPALRPVPQIAAFNRWAQDYARRNGFTYVDYHAVLAQPDGSMKPGLASDGVHPTPAGYAAMRPVALDAIRRTLAE